MMTGLCPAKVLDALSILEKQPTGKERLLRIVPDKVLPSVSEKVARIIFELYRIRKARSLARRLRRSIEAHFA